MDLQGFEVFLYQEGFSEVTISRTLMFIKQIFNHADIDDQKALSTYLLSRIKTLSPAGYNQYVKTLKRYFRYLKREPYSFIKLHQEQPKARILLTDEEIDTLLDLHTTDKYDTFWKLLAYTGARPAEIVALKVGDIDISSEVIYIHHTKTKKPRTVPIYAFLKESLLSYVNSLKGELLFYSPDKMTECISSAAYMKDWKRRLKLLGITKDAKPYSFRHTFLTRSLGNGANLFAIQDIVGHTRADTTRQYYHGNIDLMKKAAKKLPLAQKKLDPQAIVDQMSELIDEFMGNDNRYSKIELLEAKKHLYQSIKTPTRDQDQ